MRYKEYEALLKALADKNKHIHDFAMVITGGGPMAVLDIRQFLAKKTGIKSPFLLGESYDWQTKDNTGDNVRKIITGAFWILAQQGTDANNFEKRAQLLDDCQAIAEQCMARLRSIYRNKNTLPYVNWVSLEFDGEFTPLVENTYYGCRIGFKIAVPFNQQFVENPEDWQE